MRPFFKRLRDRFFSKGKQPSGQTPRPEPVPRRETRTTSSQTTRPKPGQARTASQPSGHPTREPEQVFTRETKVRAAKTQFNASFNNGQPTIKGKPVNNMIISYTRRIAIIENALAPSKQAKSLNPGVLIKALGKTARVDYMTKTRVEECQQVLRKERNRIERIINDLQELEHCQNETAFEDPLVSLLEKEMSA